MRTAARRRGGMLDVEPGATGQAIKGELETSADRVQDAALVFLWDLDTYRPPGTVEFNVQALSIGSLGVFRAREYLDIAEAEFPRQLHLRWGAAGRVPFDTL